MRNARVFDRNVTELDMAAWACAVLKTLKAGNRDSGAGTRLNTRMRLPPSLKGNDHEQTR